MKKVFWSILLIFAICLIAVKDCSGDDKEKSSVSVDSLYDKDSSGGVYDDTSSSTSVESSYDDDSSEGVKMGGKVTVNTDCPWAADEDSFEKMIRYVVDHDQAGIAQLISLGLSGILREGTTGIVTDLGFDKAKIRLDDGREVWVAVEFLD